MRIKLFFATAATAAAVLSVAACSSNSTETAASSTAAPMSASMSMTAPMSGSMSGAMMHTGTFMGLNGKMVAGTATIDGATVTLAGYSSDKGPDLHLYLTNGTTEDAVKSGVQLGSVASDKADQTFTVPASAKAADYKYVVVHCDKALAVFGAAELTK